MTRHLVTGVVIAALSFCVGFVFGALCEVLGAIEWEDQR